MFIGDNWIDPKDIVTFGVIIAAVAWTLFMAKSGRLFRCD